MSLLFHFRDGTAVSGPGTDHRQTVCFDALFLEFSNGQRGMNKVIFSMEQA
jgi:hypothetical protein